MLAAALTLFEASVCSGCGHHVDETYNPDADGWYEIRTVTCAACQAREKHGAEEKHSHGQKVYTVSTLPEGRQLRPWAMPS